MNDFTKDELDTILQSLSFFMHINHNPNINTLIHKIKNLYDATCSHEWEQGSFLVKNCKLCGETCHD